MKLYRFKCGCVGQKPRVCVDKPNIVKMVRFFNCKTQQYGMDDVVTGKRPWTQISVAAAGVVVRQITDLIEKGREA